METVHCILNRLFGVLVIFIHEQSTIWSLGKSEKYTYFGKVRRTVVYEKGKNPALHHNLGLMPVTLTKGTLEGGAESGVIPLNSTYPLVILP